MGRAAREVDRVTARVDRIENEKGYVPGNLRVCTREENSTKWWHFDKMMEENPDMKDDAEKIFGPIPTDLPF